jgi:NitT/TauT family transport system substrate-binding protein
VPNVELTWDMDEAFLTRARYYGCQMLAMKQIRKLPEYAAFLDTRFVNELAGRAR